MSDTLTIIAAEMKAAVNRYREVGLFVGGPNVTLAIEEWATSIEALASQPATAGEVWITEDRDRDPALFIDEEAAHEYFEYHGGTVPRKVPVHGTPSQSASVGGGAYEVFVEMQMNTQQMNGASYPMLLGWLEKLRHDTSVVPWPSVWVDVKACMGRHGIEVRGDKPEQDLSAEQLPTVCNAADGRQWYRVPVHGAPAQDGGSHNDKSDVVLCRTPYAADPNLVEKCASAAKGARETPAPPTPPAPDSRICVDCGLAGNSIGGGTRALKGEDWHCLGGCKPIPPASDALGRARALHNDGWYGSSIAAILDHLESQ